MLYKDYSLKFQKTGNSDDSCRYTYGNIKFITNFLPCFNINSVNFYKVTLEKTKYLGFKRPLKTFSLITILTSLNENLKTKCISKHYSVKLL